ncbi:MAG: SMC-Scp complex subunit ScpB [Negativicutes bacterium]|nr:SMC-Scp complex subunit ScpB [Negativicutes bacterium]
MRLTEQQAGFLAVLFAAGDPLPPARIGEILNCDGQELAKLREESLAAWQQLNLPLAVTEAAGGWQLCLAPDFLGLVDGLRERAEGRLSAAALETLAIIAVRQPVTRVEIEAIRGVKSERVLASLCERGLIEEAGRKDEPGRPILYATTREFLVCFGLNSCDDLPPLTLPEGKESDSG